MNELERHFAAKRRRAKYDELASRLAWAEIVLRQDSEWARAHPDDEQAQRRVNGSRAALDAIEREIGVVMSKERGRQIREDRRKRASEIAKRIRALRDDENNERYPAEFRAKQRDEREKAEREFRFVNEHARALIEQWKAEQVRESQALYHSAGDVSEQSRMLHEMEVAGLASQYAQAGPTLVRNHLVAEGRRLSALGAFDKARTYYDAAVRLGVDDSILGSRITAHLDRTLPHRKQAIEQITAIEAEVVALRTDVLVDRQAFGIGTPSEQARDSSLLKFSQWKDWRENEMLADAGREVPDTTIAAPSLD